MPQIAHYRRFHRLYLDIVGVFAIALLGWLTWPTAPAQRGTCRLPDPTVAYGEVDVNTIGSLLYPGHFAFASPLGFGSRPQEWSDTPWTVGAMLPYEPGLPLTEVPGVSLAPPLSAGIVVPSLFEIDIQSRSPPEAPLRSRLSIEIAPALAERGFTIDGAALQPLLPDHPAVGELRLYVQLGSDGLVRQVIFPPTGTPGRETMLAIERLLLTNKVPAAQTPAAGWIRFGWQHGSPEADENPDKIRLERQ